jgi:hypothetical protein
MHKHREKQKYLYAHNHFESLHHGAMYRQRLMQTKKSFVSVHRMRDKMYLEFLKALGNAHIDPRMSKFLLGRVHSEGFHGTANGQLQHIMTNTLQELQSTPVLAMHIMYGGELTHMALVNRLHDAEEKAVDSEPPQSRGVVNDVYQRLQGYLTRQAQGDAAPPNFTADDVKVIDRIHGETTGVVSPLAPQPLSFPIPPVPGSINKVLDTLSPVTKAISDIYHGENVIDTIVSAASGELNKLGSIFKGFRSADHLMDVETMGAGVVAATVGAPEVAVLGAAYATALGVVDALGASGYDTNGLADKNSTMTKISEYLNELSDFSAGRYSRYSQSSTVPATATHGRRLGWVDRVWHTLVPSGGAAHGTSSHHITIGGGRSSAQPETEDTLVEPANVHTPAQLAQQAAVYQQRITTLRGLGGTPPDLTAEETHLIGNSVENAGSQAVLERRSRFYHDKIIELDGLISARRLVGARQQADIYRTRLLTLLDLGVTPPSLTQAEEELAKFPNGTESQTLLQSKSSFYHDKIIAFNALIEANTYQARLRTLQGLRITPPVLTQEEEELARFPDGTESQTILQSKSSFYHTKIIAFDELISASTGGGVAGGSAAPAGGAPASAGGAGAPATAGAGAATAGAGAATAGAGAATTAGATPTAGGGTSTPAAGAGAATAGAGAATAGAGAATAGAGAATAGAGAATAGAGAATTAGATPTAGGGTSTPAAGGGAGEGGGGGGATELTRVKAELEEVRRQKNAAVTAKIAAENALHVARQAALDVDNTLREFKEAERDQIHNDLNLSELLSTSDPEGDTQNNMATYASLIQRSTEFLHNDLKKLTPEVRRRAVDKIRYWITQMHSEEKKAAVGTPGDMSTKVAGILQGALQEHVQSNKGNNDTAVSPSESLNAPSDVMNKLSSLLNSLAGGATQLLLSTPGGVKTPAQFAGPGTDLVNMLKSGVMGVTLADTCSRAHDIELMLAQSRAAEEMADTNIQNNLLKVAQSDMDSMYNTMLVSTITEMKKFFDNQVKDTGDHTLSRKDRAFLMSELDKTHHYIHRHVNPYRRHGKRGVR